MLKFVILCALALSAIPNTFGSAEVELPALALECLEDLKILYPTILKETAECEAIFSIGGALDAKGFEKCFDDWKESDAEARKFTDKQCDALDKTLSEGQVLELKERFQKFVNEQ